MVETAAVNKLQAVSFWKNGNEIDIIHESMPIEVKYREKIDNGDIKPVREFMRKFNVKKGTIVTKNEEREIKVEEGMITLIPAWKWVLR